MAYRSGGLLIVASSVGMLVGLGVLIAKKRFKDIFLFMLAFLSVPLYVHYVVTPAGNPDVRLWLVLPVAFLLPAWVLSGVYVFKCAVDDDEGTIVDHAKSIATKFNKNLNTRSGAIGLIVFIIATAAWGSSAHEGARPEAVGFLFVSVGWIYGIWKLFR